MFLRGLQPWNGTLIAFSLAVLLIPSNAFAQSIGTSAVPSFTLSLSPQYPAPESTATISVLSTVLDIANTSMHVTVGGKPVYDGNVQPVAVAVGAGGSSTSVVVTLTSLGATYTKSISITPQDVSLVAEPQSSAPPLYPGKPRVPQGGTTRVVAIADLHTARGAALDPAALSYAWTVDGTALDSSSGIGKDALMVSSPLQYRARTVSVVAESQDGAYVGSASLTLSPEDPSVRLYEEDPLLGILYDHALSGTYAITGSEATLYAAPFSFPTNSGAPQLEWFLNGSSAQIGPTVTLRPTGSGQGSANVSLTASSGSFLSATAAVLMQFGTKSTSIFGL